MSERNEGQKLRDLRLARKLTQQEITELFSSILRASLDSARRNMPLALGVNAQMVSKWERGLKRPSPLYRKLYSELFGIDYVSLWSEPRPATELATDRRDFLKAATALTVTDFGTISRSKRRIIRAQASPLSPEYVKSLEICITGIEKTFEYLHPSLFLPTILSQQKLAGQALESPANPSDRIRLLRAIGYIASLHANIAFNRADFRVALQMGSEALELGRIIDDPSLTNWALINLSMIKLYTGHYSECVEIADRGQCGNRPLFAYLMNFRARALARMGDSDGAERAVGECYSIMDKLQPDEEGEVGFSMSTYNRADLDCETVTVYASLGRPQVTLRMAEQACKSVAGTDKSGVRAQVKFPMAEAQLATGEVEAALSSIVEAKSITQGRRPWWFESRFQDFLVALSKTVGQGPADRLSSRLDESL